MPIDVQSLEISARSRVFNWVGECDRNRDVQPLQPSTWVKVREVVSPFSYDEALLLCEHSDDQWVVWIPDHGEAVLHISQFC